MKNIILTKTLQKPYTNTLLNNLFEQISNKNINNSITVKTAFNLDYSKEKAKNSKPLFSYYVSADHYQDINKYYQDKAFKARENLRNYLKTKVVKSKDGLKLIDYDERIIRDKNEEINYKNSFLKLSYELIPNCTPIFTTITLPSAYHVGEANQLLKSETDLEVKQDMKEFIHYKGYKKITQFNRRLYKNKVFKSGKLDKNNRSSITALEPHKDWTPHQHQLQFINDKYFIDYINIFVLSALEEELGRTQIIITKDKMNLVKTAFNLVAKVGRNGTSEHFIKGTNIFFQEFVINGENELKSVSNYLTSYIETKHIEEASNYDTKENYDKKKKNKKVILDYDGWAYYIADLKDKYELLEYGKKHKKIRRINYTQLLISRQIYKRLMNKDFIEYLANINELDKDNMYYTATKMMIDKKLKIDIYYEVFDRSQGYPKYERGNFNYLSIMYKNFYQLVDCKCFDIYDFIDDGAMRLIHENKQIDLAKDDFIIVEYKLKRNGTKNVFDVVC